MKKEKILLNACIALLNSTWNEIFLQLLIIDHFLFERFFEETTFLDKKSKFLFSLFIKRRGKSFDKHSHFDTYRAWLWRIKILA